MNIAIIGAGRMGFAQARLARYFGDNIVFAVDKDPDARSLFENTFHTTCYPSVQDSFSAAWHTVDVIWIVVCDDQIQNAAAQVGDYIAPRTIMIHTSGALSSKVIKQVCPHNPCASLHPLVACPLKNISDEECWKSYDGIIHSFEGDPEAVAVAKIIVSRCHGRFVHIQSDKKSLYHAAAVFASNYPVTLLYIASKLFQDCGMDEAMAMSASRRLLNQTNTGIQSATLIDALTGPAKRHDMCTIASHQNSLLQYPQIAHIYNVLLDETFNMLKPDRSDD